MAEPTPLTPDPAAELLKALADIDLPGEVSWWPPAPGWWVLGVLGIVVAIWVIRAVASASKRNRYRKETLARLNESYKTFTESGDSKRYLADSSQLLRRACIHLAGRTEIAKLTGKAWINRLNSLTANPLSESAGETFAEASYRPTDAGNIEQLHQELVKVASGLGRQTDGEAPDA